MKDREIDPVLEYIKNDGSYDENWNAEEAERHLTELKGLANSEIHPSLQAFHRKYKVRPSEFSNILSLGGACYLIKNSPLFDVFVNSGFIPISTYYSQNYGFLDNTTGRVYVFDIAGLNGSVEELEKHEHRSYFLKWREGEFESVTAYITHKYHEKTKD